MFREIRIPAADGLLLYARDYGPETAIPCPVLCLAGLTRNCRDFEAIAPRLAATRRVIAPDYRGRGLSQYAPDGASYRPAVELADALALLDHLGIARAALIGTSRGGIIAMLMAIASKHRLAGVLLNDIGPRIEPGFMLRLRGYLGKPQELADWPAAVAVLKLTNPGLENLADARWLAFARRVYGEAGGRPVMNYDPALLHNFPSEEAILSAKDDGLWEVYGLLAGLPVTLLHGANTDILSPATIADMVRRLPGLEAVTVKDRGHVPFLDEPESLAAIDRWLARVDGW